MKYFVSDKIKMTKTTLLKNCMKLKSQKKGVSSYLKQEGYTPKEILVIKAELTKAKPVKVAAVKKPQCAKNEEVMDDIVWKNGLKFTEKYVYNKADDKYIVYLKAANGNVVIPGDTVRGLIENYSNWYGNERSVNDICRNYRIPRNYFNELKDVLGITHDSEPVSKEELVERDIEELTEDILQKKRFQLQQVFQKKSWAQTEAAAEKWFKMQEGVYEPFTSFLSTWQPPKYTPVKYTGPAKKSKATNKSILVGLSDIHFGSKSNVKASYRNKSYSTQQAMDSVANYAEGIRDIVEERNYSFDECVLASMGDILHTTGQGFTTKGTMLVHDCIKAEQFDFAFQTCTKFINDLLSLFPKVLVKSVKGNHNDFGDYILFKALEAYFRTEKRITFDVFQSDHGLFKINKCLFVISHGYSAEYKGRIPTAGKARESYITNLFLSKPEALQGVTQKVLLTADQHHLEMKEYAEFEHYMLSTTVLGDQHSEALGLNNIARQSCFIIGEDGIKEMVYCYASSH